jgi:DNA-binding XRE family transcriptional regulator
LKRKKTKVIITARQRVWRVVKVTKTVLLCERPYVLFGEAVRQRRLERGFTQQELADKLKMSRASIANIEVGRQRVLLGDIFVFAKALSMTASRLFDAVQK